MLPTKRFFTSIATGFGLASLIIGSVGFISYRSLTQLLEDSRQAAHTQKVLAELENLVSLLKDAETGQRGYLLTGDSDYLEPYRTASGTIQLKIVQLRKLTADNPNYLLSLNTVEELMVKKLAELKQTINLRSSKGYEAALQVVLTNKGKNLMDEIRSHVTEMEREQEKLLQQRQLQTQASTRNTIVAFSIGILLTFFILIIVYYFIYSETASRHRSEIALQQAEQKYRSIFENAVEGIFQTSSSGQYLTANPTLARIYGYSSPSELIQNISNIENQLYVNQNRRAEFIRLLNEHNRVSNFESEVYRADGSTIWISEQARTVRDAAGNLLYYEGSVENITKRKLAEEALCCANSKLTGWVDELEQRNREIMQLSAMSDILQACISLEEAYSALATLIQPLFPSISGAVFTINASTNLVEAVATWGEVLASLTLFTPSDCWALRRSRLHWVKDVHSHVLCKHFQETTSSHCESLCIPMMAQGEALGLLYLNSQQHNQLSEAKQRLAVTVAEQIALALANLKLRESLRNQSIRDPLTGLFNRRYLEESLEREVNRAERKQQSVGILMIDVDHFKRFNDTFGHEAGDIVLRELGLFLRKQTRGSDIACRYGGEELTLILPEASLEATMARAEQLREGVKHLNVQHRRQPLGVITISLGVACFPVHGLTGASVIEAADAALYRAKKEGRDRCCTAGGRAGSLEFS